MKGMSKESKLEIHELENNAESERHLKENAKKFSQQCLKVLELLYQGKKLTTMSAPSYGILSLPRRIKDLRDYNKVHIIEEEWLYDANGKRLVKQWFINPRTEKARKGDVVKEWRGRLKKDHPEHKQLELL